METKNYSEWQAVLDLEYKKAPAEDIMKAAQVVLGDVSNMFEDGQTLMDFAIANNVTELIGMLLEMGFYLCPTDNEDTNTMPYLHMACMYGNVDIVSLLVKYRRQDLDSRISVEDPYWKKLAAAHFSRSFLGPREGLDARLAAMTSKDRTLTALEVAAVFLRRSCLIKLLNVSGISQEEWLESIAATGLSLVMRDLMGAVDSDALNFDFKESLCTMSPEYLETVLQRATDHNVMLNLQNPYHYMYTSGSWGLKDEPVTCTDILLRHGWDVNAVAAPFTFPMAIPLSYHDPPSAFALYILIDLFLPNYDEKSLSDELACFKLVLKSGANPNFFEPHKGWYSAAKVLVDMLGYCRLSSVIHRVRELLKLLFDCGCDYSIADSQGLSVLHVFLGKIASVLLGDDLDENVLEAIRKTYGTLMLYGADVRCGDHRKTPIAHFSLAVSNEVDFCIHSDAYVNDPWPDVEHVRFVYKFLHTMEQKDVHEAVNASLDYLDRPAGDIGHDFCQDLQNILRQELVNYISAQRYRSLQHRCLMKVWQCCGRNLANFSRLSVPVILKDCLVEMFTG